LRISYEIEDMTQLMMYRKSKQGGLATLLVLLLVGVAISAAVFGSLRYIQGAQSQMTTLHAQTQAQMKAWSGVDIVLSYLNQLIKDKKLKDLLGILPEKGQGQPIPVNINDPSIKAIFYKEPVAGTNNIHLYAEITGISESGNRAQSSSTVQVVYLIEDRGESGSGSINPTTSTVFRGGVSITGGTTEFISGDELADIAVEGNLTLGSASKAGISGCVSGNVNMTGGGIKNNAVLYAGGDFTASSMTAPNNATIWARNVNISQEGGSYISVKSGAYAADVFSGGGGKIGTASVGGRLIAGTTNAGIPWQTGTIVPFTDHNFVIRLTNGSEFLIKPGSADIDNSTGIVTNFAYETLAGEGNLPDTLQFKASGTSGGTLGFAKSTVGLLWGHAVSITGWSGSYTEVRANGNFNVATGTIGKLTGGGGLHATSGNCNHNTDCWNYPLIMNPSHIAGEVKIGSYSGTPTPPNFNLSSQVANTSPGLPGAPYCDTRTNEVDASSLKSQANYVFERVNGSPQLTIRNVELSNGTKIDGVYDLVSDDLRTWGKYDFLACGWGSNHCFRDGNSWNLTGIYAFPPGIAWFDGPVTINGVSDNNAVTGLTDSKDILATIISSGNITLTSSGHGKLIAPNFNVGALCQGSFRPTNLCSSGQLITWTEASTVYTGLPLGNVAILTEGKLEIAGWTINGHVVLGENMITSANQSIINGRLIVGANKSIQTRVEQGGFKIVTDTLTESQLQMPGVEGSGDAGSVGGLKVSVLWSRYL